VYPAGKKPSVAHDDYMYMAVICADEKGNPVLPYIVGRGRSAGYSDDYIATQEMIAEREWMARFPHCCPFEKFEYLDITIDKCIP